MPTPISESILAHERSKHVGLFGEVTYPLLPPLRIIAGARYSTDHIKGDLDREYLGTPIAIIPGLNSPGAIFGPYQTASSVNDAEWSYRTGLQWDIVKDIMVYGTVSRGYKAAGLDLGITITPIVYGVNQLRVNPEISQNYEVGLRSEFFNRRLTVNLTAFHEIFTNFQIASRLPVAAAVFSLQNAKQLKSTGGTLAISAHVVPKLTLSSNVGYVHARYTDFSNASCYPGEPTAPVGTSLVRGICVNGIQTLNGWPLQSSPKWRGNLTARYDTGDLIEGLNIFGQANLYYQSHVVYNSVADPHEQQAGYSIVNLDAGLGPKDGSWRLSVYAANVFDKKFVARILPGLSGANYVNSVTYDARARYGVSLDFQL